MPRKKPFSGKQKKKQMQDKRDKKKDSHGVYGDEDVQELEDGPGCKDRPVIMRVDQQPVNSKELDPNRYRLHFLKVTEEELRKRRSAARKPIVAVSEKDLEMSVESVHGEGTALDFPKRPPWDYRLSKQQLERQEHAYFQGYVNSMLTAEGSDKLSYFELNLETWRQLWRVTEISDILLLIADIRYPMLHLPPSLYHYLRETLRREVVIVLNKVDLAPPALVASWHAYLQATFPEARIVCFTSLPKPPNAPDQGLNSRTRKRSSLKPLGPQQLLDVCKAIVLDKVNLESWQHKLDTEDPETSAPEISKEDDKEDVAMGNACSDRSQDGKTEAGYVGAYRKFKEGVLTIGLIGFPNVGKSSLLNGLVGKKVVSVSKTPGHTKHLQTIFLTPTVRLCDCPGLVFPTYVHKSLQVLSGLFPIAQERVPYSGVGYLAERVDLPRLLNITHPDAPGKSAGKQSAWMSAGGEKTFTWSAYDICEGWAAKCGFFTAKACRPDTYRAANYILRLAVEGRLLLCLHPPGFSENPEAWRKDAFAQELTRLLQDHSNSKPESFGAGPDGSSSDSEEDMEADDERDADSDGQNEGGDSNPFALLADD